MTKKAKSTKTVNDHYHPVYVGIPQPKEVHKNLLECSKEIINVLKDYHSLMEIRELKSQQMKELGRLIKEIKSSMVLLKKVLPNVPEEHHRAITQKPVQPSNPSLDEQQVPTTSPELAKLESELRSIESKLSGI